MFSLVCYSLFNQYEFNMKVTFKLVVQGELFYNFKTEIATIKQWTINKTVIHFLLLTHCAENAIMISIRAFSLET